MSKEKNEIESIDIIDVDVSKKNTSSYRSIFKATSLFGGVQVYQILISIIKSKIIAVLLGPTGVGIQGLYTSATQLIRGLSSFGLSQSAVKNVSEAHATGDNQKVNLVVTVLRKLVWITGLFGTVLVIVLSPYLSKTTFGNSDYVLPLIILSITLLLDQLAAGQKVLLQGTRRLKDLAKASAIGATLGLIVSVPIYYLFGIRGIVPTLILNSLTALLLTWYFSKRIEIEKVEVNLHTVCQEGKGMLQMGFAVSVSNILVYLSSYILRSYIRHEGGIDEVGLFAAGFTLMNTYGGLVFTAMSTDYYPRLASVNTDNEKCRAIMNQQAEIGILILAPLMALLIICVPIAIRLLYTSKFLGVNLYVVWAALGMMFKMASWAISFIFIAKGESKLFIINETAANLYNIVFYLIGYHLGGMSGLGLATMLGFFIYTLQVYFISHSRYRFSFSVNFKKLFLVQFLMVLLCVAVTLEMTSITKYFVGVLLVFLSGLYSLNGLENRIGLKNLLKSRFNKL